ncbi:ADP-ribosylation factor-like protein 2-binding protein isoform X2 [Leptopilina boulardi]|uniref:ADP-ribosylation factor-like protein 2-binding protein isoform X2 n=1 Tax=Leptopilina boulardi TaxID=63433 RepID=UPI0021F557D8|nr:ADP-ribosylation factor-like protein 2-binding protein isoform X2 [Leptopilina boulardi]
MAQNVGDCLRRNKITVDDFSFDEVIGLIEDILMEDDFQTLQQRYLEKYWQIFEPIEENKLIYMDIFNDYNRDIETFLENNLKKVIPNFSMTTFLKQLSNKKSELEGEIFEILLAFTDFLAFKEMILDYRAVKEGKVEDLSGSLFVTPLKSCNLSDND